MSEKSEIRQILTGNTVIKDYAIMAAESGDFSLPIGGIRGGVWAFLFGITKRYKEYHFPDSVDIHAVLNDCFERLYAVELKSAPDAVYGLMKSLVSVEVLYQAEQIDNRTIRFTAYTGRRPFAITSLRRAFWKLETPIPKEVERTRLKKIKRKSRKE